MGWTEYRPPLLSKNWEVMTETDGRFKEAYPVGCQHLHTIQPCKLLFGTVMYGYQMDQNPEEGLYSLNLEAGHHVFKTMENGRTYNREKCNFFKIFFFL